MSFFARWLITSVAVAVAVRFVPGLTPVGDQFFGTIAFAFSISFVNVCIRPLMRIVSLPLTIITLGLFRFVVNALALSLASWLSLNVTRVGVSISNFTTAIIASIVISIISSIVTSVLGVEKSGRGRA